MSTLSDNKDFATASGHWYGLDGSPQYTIIGKNGNARNTTLRDAREHKLVPSVTGIIKMAAAPALEKWKRNQVLLSALTLTRKDGEPEADWLARVEQDWQEQGRAAAYRGTAIHGAIERYFLKKGIDHDYVDWVKAVEMELIASCNEQGWLAERSFASALGYGGKTDLHSSEWVVDIKSKDDLEKCELYDEHLMQLSSYRRGLKVDKARCGILFVSRDLPQAKFVEADEEDLQRGLVMFDCLLLYYFTKTCYNPTHETKT